MELRGVMLGNKKHPADDTDEEEKTFRKRPISSKKRRATKVGLF